jgi:predicted lipoprotein with Yx(FWY)xxD motif
MTSTNDRPDDHSDRSRALRPTRGDKRPSTRRGPRSARLLCTAFAAGALLLASACGTGDYVDAKDALPAGGTAATGTGGATVVPTGGLGTAITPVGTVATSDGFTLYRFAKDNTKPSTSTCTGECVTAWPPVLGDGLPAVQGIPSNLIGTVGRPDGNQQLTLNGWPLYRFAKDAVPGDVKGEGVGGTWQAIGVDGKPAATDGAAGGHLNAAPTPTPAAARAGSAGY